MFGVCGGSNREVWAGEGGGVDSVAINAVQSVRGVRYGLSTMAPSRLVRGRKVVTVAARVCTFPVV